MELETQESTENKTRNTEPWAELYWGSEVMQQERIMHNTTARNEKYYNQSSEWAILERFDLIRGKTFLREALGHMVKIVSRGGGMWQRVGGVKEVKARSMSDLSRRTAVICKILGTCDRQILQSDSQTVACMRWVWKTLLILWQCGWAFLSSLVLNPRQPCKQAKKESPQESECQWTQNG